jgi:outer membrane protein insertion porin family
VPGSDLEYFKLVYSGQRYFPISNTFTGRLRTELGYGDGYGGTKGLPFFENFYTGGFSSVRGYKSNTIGPRSSSARFPSVVTADGGQPAYVIDSNGNLVATNVDNDADPFGGNILLEAGAELLFRLPFVKDHRSVRTGFFVDMGNVFSSDCRDTQLSCSDIDLSELRYSAGVGLTWITGFGPLTFSLAKALNSGEDDETEVFQFSLGTGF